LQQNRFEEFVAGNLFGGSAVKIGDSPKQNLTTDDTDHAEGDRFSPESVSLVK
jgi:hypothetical protein